ncbi:RDD family protein [Isoptericola halotolerans]|uniref:RDD family protein n=1 Tax=Isoptericola halotolerans TaxID=300560 RepID=UPI00388EE8A2
MKTTFPAPDAPSPWPSPTSPMPSPGRGRPGPFPRGRSRASWWNRVLAVLLDSALVSSVAWFATGSAPSFAALPTWGAQDPPLAPESTVWVGWTMLGLAVLQAYTGATPGKRVARIAVVDAGSGRPIGLLGTVLRWLAHFLDAILMLGYLRAAWHPEGRTFADSLLGTVVQHTVRPRPHRWVAWCRQQRDRHAPWLRWPPVVTSTVALVVCAAAAAGSLTAGGGSAESAADATTSCVSTGPFAATAMVSSSVSSSWESRLGVERTTEQSWRVAAGWSTGLGLDATDNPDVTVGEAVLSVRSADGRTYAAASPSDEGEDPLWWSMPDQVAATDLEAPEDVSGWDARVVLLDDDGEALAECTAPVPAVEAVGSP